MTDQTSPETEYADLVRDLHQASDEYDRGHGPLHALAANAIEHLTTLLQTSRHAQCQQDSALRELLEFWIYDGRLQTFEDRDRFRKAARTALSSSPAVCEGK